jgi:hypothetical protein
MLGDEAGGIGAFGFDSKSFPHHGQKLIHKSGLHVRSTARYRRKVIRISGRGGCLIMRPAMKPSWSGPLETVFSNSEQQYAIGFPH